MSVTSRRYPACFRDYPALVVRNAGSEREMIMMRWGMPPPPRAGSFPVTNIRNTAESAVPGSNLSYFKVTSGSSRSS
jgi:hypothetical protein